MGKHNVINTLLIANRGEIVCRIIATCRAMGIKTVTVYAPDDKDLPHAMAGDISVMLEGDSLADTYLNIDRLVDIAKETGADAIHPGYGFLSENAAFAKAIDKAGLLFVGPTADVISRMGDKAASRKLCETIGVPVIPGYHGDAQDDATLAKQASEIGFPVLVKAAAGGGGKGMRVVEREKDIVSALASARQEAKNAFGDDHLLVEKYLIEPRHIEIQVFSDTHGNHLHMYERECSIQRRHQKIVEESPAPGLPEKTRQDMMDCALKITSHIDYVGAGTMEFILDKSGSFYFLEMNTRLQVEHPVTEMVTNLDLVRLQLDVAQGQALPFSQSDITQTGHAVEVRLYAEDPDKEFLPAPGHLTAFTLPHLPSVRCENGYHSGNDVSSSYDPMVAKVVAHGVSRDEAIDRLSNALEQTILGGVTSNRTFLLRVLQSKAFKEGKTHTNFIPEHKDTLFDKSMTDEQMAQIIAAQLLFGNRGYQPSAHASDTEHSAWTDSKLAGFR